MATMAASSDPPPPRQPPPSSTAGGGSRLGTGEKLPMPSRNPLPLSASQEAQVREVFNERVRGLCGEEIKAFAECARGRTFTIPFVCGALGRAMNGCMATHATQAEHDRAREEWFARRMERVHQRELKEHRKIAQEQFHREWWGLPPKDPEEVAREEEKLRRPERVAGVVRRRGAGDAGGTGG